MGLLEEAMGEAKENVRRKFRVPEEDCQEETPVVKKAPPSRQEPKPARKAEPATEVKKQKAEVKSMKAREEQKSQPTVQKPRQKRGMALSSVAVVGGVPHSIEMIGEFSLPGYPLNKGERLAIVKLSPLGR